MQSDRQFDHSEVRGEMTAGHGDLREDELPDLLAQLDQLVWRELTQVGRLADSFEHGPGRRGRHQGSAHRELTHRISPPRSGGRYRRRSRAQPGEERGEGETSPD